jgi:hypothetical protein
MKTSLAYNTVNPLLIAVLTDLMREDAFSDFILKNFTDFEKADDDFDPNCLRGKFWEVIKADFLDEITKFRLKD